MLIYAIDLYQDLETKVNFLSKIKANGSTEEKENYVYFSKLLEEYKEFKDVDEEVIIDVPMSIMKNISKYSNYNKLAKQ